MGGQRRNPNDDIFKPQPKPVVRARKKAHQPEKPPKLAPAGVELEELVFGKRKKK